MMESSGQNLQTRLLYKTSHVLKNDSQFYHTPNKGAVAE